MSPKVSVLIPTFNRLHWLPGAIESVMIQEADLELLVLDNGSQDGTWAYLQEAAAREPRLRVFRFEENSLATAYSFLYTQALGPYFCHFADDDEMMPGGLAPKVAILDAHPEIGLVYSTVREMDEEGKDLCESTMGRRFAEDKIGGAAEFSSLILANYIPMPSVLFRREVMSYWQGGATNFGPASDWQIWLSALQRVDAAYVRKPTVRLRTHRGQDSQQRGLKEKQFLDSHILVWRYWMLEADPPFVPSSQAWRYMQSFQTRIAHLSHGNNESALTDALHKMEAIREEQNRKLEKAYESRNAMLSEAFLYEPDWSTSEWAEVLLSYFEAFLPGDPVALILPLYASNSMDLKKAQSLVVDLVKRSGRESFPDVVLLDDPAELLDQLRNRHHIQWIPKGKGCVDGLCGAFGARLAQARQQIAANGTFR